MIRKFGFSRLAVEEYLAITFHENLSSGRRAVACGRTDKMNLTVDSPNFANADQLIVYKDIFVF